MSWLSLISTVLSLLNRLTTFLQEKQLINAGESKEAARVLGEADGKIKEALDAKRITRGELERDPSRLRDTDEFTRSD